MLDWAARGLLILGGFVASWIVAKDAPQFELVQMAAGLFLLIILVYVLGFWSERRTRAPRGVHSRR